MPKASIRQWLASIGMARYIDKFQTANIQPGDVPSLTETRLREIGVLHISDMQKILQHAGGILTVREVLGRAKQ